MSIEHPISPPPFSHAWVDLDLGALVRNARLVQSRASRPLLPMLKADAYGLGAIAVAHALESIDPWGYGLAIPAEGATLRAAGITRPLLVFSAFDPRERELCLVHDLRPVIGDVESLHAWLPTGRPFHLEIDTGLSRCGIRWNDTDALARCASLVAETTAWEGICTHFHSPDTDPGSVSLQRQRLAAVLETLGRRPPLVHLASSADAVRALPHREEDLVRPGIFLYGGAVAEATGEPVAAFRAPIVSIRSLSPGDTVSYDATWTATRPTRLGTIAAGYADGVPRALGSVGQVEVGGTLAPIVGTVAMDFTMVDLTDVAARRGDVVTIWGGDGGVSLDAQAGAAGTISYELLTRIGPRVIRRPVEAA